MAVVIREALADLKIENCKSGCSRNLTLSIGIGSQAVRPGSYSRELLIRVDTALKLARERGRDRIEVLEG
jgi:PleD family two-component response regulator